MLWSTYGSTFWVRTFVTMWKYSYLSSRHYQTSSKNIKNKIYKKKKFNNFWCLSDAFWVNTELHKLWVFPYSMEIFTNDVHVYRQTRALSVSSKVFHGTTRGKVRHRFAMEDGNKFLSGIATFLWVTLSLRRSCSGRSNGMSAFQQLKTKMASFSIVLWSEITPWGLRRVTSPCFPSNLKDCRLINHNPQVTTTTQDCSVTFFVLDLKPTDPRSLGTSRHL